jgi:hypothetical protein
VSSKPKLVMEYGLYARVVAMSALEARTFWGGDVEPFDLGPADATRYKDGARVWGFPSRRETAAEKAARIWDVAHGRTVER